MMRNVAGALKHGMTMPQGPVIRWVHRIEEPIEGAARYRAGVTRRHMHGLCDSTTLKHENVPVE